jgi:MIP family channel proteins
MSQLPLNFLFPNIHNISALVGISLSFGLTISVLAYGIGHLSGGHINPAVTFSFMVLKLQSIKAGLLYMLAQFSGAFLGALILWGCSSSLTAFCYNESPDGVIDGSVISGVCKASALPDGSGYGPAFGLGVNQVGPRVSSGSAFLIECMGTYLLVFTVLHAAVHSKSTAGNAAPIAIGWAVLVAHLVLIPFTGCGINPARSFGPMIVDTIGGLGHIVWIRGWWVFYTAPFVGAGFAAATYKFLFEEKDEVAASKKDDDLEAGGVEKAPDVPQAYEEGAKNAGEAGETENAVPQAYE